MYVGGECFVRIVVVAQGREDRDGDCRITLHRLTFFQAQYPTLEALVFQSRLLGILYLGLAAASYVMLARV